MSQLPPMAVQGSRHLSWEAARIRLYLFSLSLDMLILLFAFAAANLFLFGTFMGQPGKPHGLVMFAMIAPVYGLMAIGSGLYGLRNLEDWRSTALRAIWLLTQAALLTFLIIYLGKISAQLSRLTFLAGLIISAVFLAAARPTMLRLSRRWLSGLPPITAVITDGMDVEGQGWALRIDAAAEGIDPCAHDAATAARLAAAVAGAERVIVACSMDRMADWSAALKSLAAKGEILLPELMRFAPAKVGEYHHHPTIIVAGGPLHFRDRVAKRALDLAVAIPAVVLLAPVLIVVALIVKFSSPGPVLFRQPRLGLDARPFNILKFRTMRTELSDVHGSRLTERNDPRVTPVGAFFRRTSLDELPQILNVLKGEMSIVGPRPHAAGAKAGDRHYWEVDQRYWARHCIKPGMTGLAQVRGHRGPTDAHQDLIDRLQSDLEYVTEWSIWRDLKIIVATLGVLAHDNAV